MRIRGCSAAVFDLSAQLLAGVVLNVGHQDAGTLFGESFGGFAPIRWRRLLPGPPFQSAFA